MSRCVFRECEWAAKEPGRIVCIHCGEQPHTHELYDLLYGSMRDIEFLIKSANMMKINLDVRQFARKQGADVEKDTVSPIEAKK